MYTIEILVIAVLIAVTDAKGGHLKGAISDDLELKPADILSSLSAEFTKSDVEITLGGRAAEDGLADAIEANDDSTNDKNQENAGERKSEQETVGVNSPEDTQKITHTSDVNASFIHVKEKIARQSSAEEYAEGDELERDASSEELEEQREPKHASDSDDLRNPEETLSSEVPERRSFDEKEVEASEKSDPAGVDDTQDQFELDTDGEDDDIPMQSRRMLSFDPKLLDAVNIPKMIEAEPVLELRSGQNDYKLHTPGIHDYDHGHHEHHIGETDGRRGFTPETNPLQFAPLNTPSLPPLALFHSSRQPQHPHSQLPDNTERHPHPLDNNLQNPEFTHNFNEDLHFDKHLIRQFNPQLFPHQLEQIKPGPTLQQFHLPQIQHKPQFQASQPSQLSTFQSLQPSRSFHSFESWQPLQTLRSMNPPQPTVVASSSAVTSFQPSQMHFNNNLPTLRDASPNPVHSEMSNQFSGVVHRNWNWSV